MKICKDGLIMVNWALRKRVPSAFKGKDPSFQTGVLGNMAKIATRALIEMRLKKFLLACAVQFFILSLIHAGIMAALSRDTILNFTIPLFIMGCARKIFLACFKGTFVP